MSQILDDGGLNILAELIKQVNQIRTDLNSLITNFNIHQHKENTAGAYAQNATTDGPIAISGTGGTLTTFTGVAGVQTASGATAITLKK